MPRLMVGSADVTGAYNRGVTTPFGDAGGGGIFRHSPVWVSSCSPGRQNGAHPLVTPVSPGRHAELTAGVTMVTTPIGDAASTATDNAVRTPRHTGLAISRSVGVRTGR